MSHLSACDYIENAVDVEYCVVGDQNCSCNANGTFINGTDDL